MTKPGSQSHSQRNKQWLMMADKCHRTRTVIKCFTLFLCSLSHWPEKKKAVWLLHKINVKVKLSTKMPTEPWQFATFQINYFNLCHNLFASLLRGWMVGWLVGCCLSLVDKSFNLDAISFSTKKIVLNCLFLFVHFFSHHHGI